MAENISIRKHRNIKARIKRLEHKNYDTIYCLPCAGDKGWYEIAERSALFYYYGACHTLGIRAKFNADTASFYDQYELGFIRFRGVDSLRENLQKAGMLDDEKRDDGVYVFKLKYQYSEQEISEMIKREKTRRNRNLATVPTGSLDPHLHQYLVHSSARLHRLCNGRLDKLSSQQNGARIVRLIDNLLLIYYQLAMFEKTPVPQVVTKFEEMRHDIYALIIEVQILSVARLWDAEVCASICETLFLARDRIELNLKKYQKKLTQSSKKPANSSATPPKRTTDNELS